MDKIKVMFFPSGNTAVFRNGVQVPKLQESWLSLFVQKLVEHGIDPTEVDFNLPSGDRAVVFETSEGGYNWRLV